MSNLIKRNTKKEKGMIERRDVTAGFKFVLREFGEVHTYVVLTDEETAEALGADFLKWLKRKPEFKACRNIKSNLTEAKHIDIICKEGKKAAIK